MHQKMGHLSAQEYARSSLPALEAAYVRSHSLPVPTIDVAQTCAIGHTL